MWRKWLSGLVATAVVAGFALFIARPAQGVVVESKEPGRTVVTLSMEGARQGRITDDRNPTELISFDYSVKTPREAGSGLATGRRQYQPLLIRKRIDKASPLLMRAMATNELLKTVAVKVTQPTGETYQIKLTNASIADVHQTVDDDGVYEEVSFTFQTIELTFADKAGVRTTATDDWAQQ